VIDLDTVRAAILATVAPLPPVDVARADALGLVLAGDVVSRDAVPPFANTAMDGYALRAADTAGASEAAPVRLRVIGTLAAGAAPSVTVDDGEALRIMTGAPMPDGADAVVMVELTERDGDDVVLVQHEAILGEHVREAGGDVQVGELVFAAGTLLGAAHLGVLASIGVDRVPVHPRPRVGIISTGDELVESGAVGPGQIRDSNRPMLVGLLTRAGFTPVDLGIVRDDEAAVTAAIGAALERCDALLTSGGVRVGRRLRLREQRARAPGVG